MVTRRMKRNGASRINREAAGASICLICDYPKPLALPKAVLSHAHDNHSALDYWVCPEFCKYPIVLARFKSDHRCVAKDAKDGKAKVTKDGKHDGNDGLGAAAKDGKAKVAKDAKDGKAKVTKDGKHDLNDGLGAAA